jgi:hypothetical protein
MAQRVNPHEPVSSNEVVPRVSPPDQTDFQIRVLNQILSESCKIHNFQTVHPKFTNFMSLEI